MAWRQNAVLTQGQHVAGHVRHRLAVADIDQANLVIAQPVQKVWRQGIGTGQGKARRAHRKDHIKVQEVVVERHDPHLPPFGPQPIGVLRGTLGVGAPAAGADGRQTGADQVDIAAFDRASGRHFPHPVVVEIQDRRIFTAPLRHGEHRQHRTKGRDLRGIAGVDLILQMRLGRQVMARHPGLVQRRLEFRILCVQPGAVQRCAGRQGGAGNRVGWNPGVIVRAAQKHVRKAAGFRLQGPGHEASPCLCN